MESAEESWTTLQTYSFLHEAAVVGGMLENRGVPVRILDAAFLGVAPHAANAMGGVRLQVRDVDRAYAASVLATQSATEPLTDEELGFADEEEDGETEEAARASIIERLARRAFVASLLGISVLPIVGSLVALQALISFHLRRGESASRGSRIRVAFAWSFVSTAAILAVVLLRR